MSSLLQYRASDNNVMGRLSSEVERQKDRESEIISTKNEIFNLREDAEKSKVGEIQSYGETGFQGAMEIHQLLGIARNKKLAETLSNTKDLIKNTYDKYKKGDKEEDEDEGEGEEEDVGEDVGGEEEGVGEIAETSFGTGYYK